LYWLIGAQDQVSLPRCGDDSDFGSQSQRSLQAAMDDDAGGGGALPSRGRRAGGASSPPRGAADGIRKDHERAKLARAKGETLKSGTAWSNGAAGGRAAPPL
jgi:hypothetical protein